MRFLRTGRSQVQILSGAPRRSGLHSTHNPATLRCCRIFRNAPSLLLSAKSHACCGYALVNAGITPPLRYQLFAGNAASFLSTHHTEKVLISGAFSVFIGFVFVAFFRSVSTFCQPFPPVLYLNAKMPVRHFPGGACFSCYSACSTVSPLTIPLSALDYFLQSNELLADAP